LAFATFRAEIPANGLNLRFALILEAYLYGNIPHMKILFRQFEALNKMKALNERVSSYLTAVLLLMSGQHGR